MSDYYPLRFEPIYRHYLWGGDRLKTHFDRDLDSAIPHAESWEIVDHAEDQSTVQYGPLARRTLHQLVTDHSDAILGQSRQPSAKGPLADRFPLLMKFLDAADNLSVQVHPDDTMAARLDPPELGKTEAWYVLATEPGGRIYAGLKPGVDREVLAQAVREGTCADCLHWFEPKPGDALLITAGTVHSLGAGVMVAEIQQASDVTFRLFDWNRVGPDGNPRPLHVEQALEAIDFDSGPLEPVHVEPASPGTARLIVQCDYFSLSRCDLVEPLKVGGDGCCHLLVVLDGAAMVEGDPSGMPLSSGQTVLLPAALPSTTIFPREKTALLDIRLP